MQNRFLLLPACSLLSLVCGCATAFDAPTSASAILRPATPLTVDLPLGDHDDPPATLHQSSFHLPLLGLTAEQTQRLLGQPAQRLGADVWVYWQSASPQPATENGGFDTLVVVFERATVSLVRRINGDALRARLAKTTGTSR